MIKNSREMPEYKKSRNFRHYQQTCQERDRGHTPIYKSLKEKEISRNESRQGSERLLQLNL